MENYIQADLIFKYFPNLTDWQKQQMLTLSWLYSRWNSRINVISRKDMNNFYLHHVLHSLAIAKLLSFKSGTKIMDAGTGGGFPGIPLAILFPEVQFYLVDSIGKKVKVVREVARALKLENVDAKQIRAEQVTRTFDFVVSRAVTDLEAFTQWTLRKVQPRSFNRLSNGILYLKGMGVEEEINRVRKLKKTKVSVYLLEHFFKEDFFKTKQIVHVYR